MSEQLDRSGELEDIGLWMEIKHEIVRKYAASYSAILTARGFYRAYIDAFAGAGHYLSRTRGDIVPGSAAIALELVPPFQHHHLVEVVCKRSELEDCLKAGFGPRCQTEPR